MAVVMALSKIKTIQRERGISYIRWHRLISYRLSIVTEFFVLKQPLKMSNVTRSICSRDISNKFQEIFVDRAVTIE